MGLWSWQRSCSGLKICALDVLAAPVPREGSRLWTAEYGRAWAMRLLFWAAYAISLSMAEPGHLEHLALDRSFHPGVRICAQPHTSVPFLVQQVRRAIVVYLLLQNGMFKLGLDWADRNVGYWSSGTRLNCLGGRWPTAIGPSTMRSCR